MNENIPQYLREQAEAFPNEPGVYRMLDENGSVIYVGKAKNLRKRISNYVNGQDKRVRVPLLLASTHSLEFTITGSEMEALVLEMRLIKQYSPKYNVLLKDGKQFPYVRINMHEKYPRVEVVRKVEKDGAKYIGPFLSAYSINNVMDEIRKLYPLRSCKGDISKMIEKGQRPCLNAQMGLCLAPCQGGVSEEKYDAVLKEVISIFRGGTGELKRRLTDEMQKASEAMEFERAAALRDKLRLLENVKAAKMISLPVGKDCDVIGAAVSPLGSSLYALFIRGEKIGHERNVSAAPFASAAEVVSGFIKAYYSEQEKNRIPARILVSDMPEDAELIEEWLTEKKGARVSLNLPQRGEGLGLVSMAKKNAMHAVERKRRRQRDTEGAAQALGMRLDIPYPRRIECYDISNTQGTDSVASMVVFTDGKPDKKEYRKFKIKTVEGANDFASMAEVLRRRLMRGMTEDTGEESGFGHLPDLIIVDGGKGQLSSALGILRELNLEAAIPIVGLAKREEEIFIPGKDKSLLLGRRTPEFRLVVNIRDEAHRFAITFHRARREKRIVSSALDAIPGIGPKRKAALLSRMGSVDAIREASIDELASIAGVNEPAAKAVYRYFRTEEMKQDGKEGRQDGKENSGETE